MTRTNNLNAGAADVAAEAGKAAKSGGSPTHAAKSGKSKGPAPSPAYQDALDEALEETFPASDPIAPTVRPDRARPK